MNLLKLGALVVAALLVSVPASAQFDLTGKWASRSSQDAMERGPGPDPVDYLGLPLNDEGRARALSYNYSMLSLPDGQCGYHTPFYIVLGPFGLHIWNEFDPVTGRLVAWKIGAWVDRDVTTIWMDGRPHPSPNAPRTYSGFTTGRWDGNTLVVRTTNLTGRTAVGPGGPHSTAATITERFTRLDANTLQYEATIDDPETWTRPWTIAFPWRRDGDYHLFEYACHEGNYAMRNILSGERAKERGAK